MYLRYIFILLFISVPFLLSAHGSHGSGVMAGFTHPIFGLDHAFAILGTGCLGYIVNPSKWFIGPLAFLTTMIIGGLLGIGNEATFLIEKVIAFSVLAIGIIIALKLKLNLISSIIILAIFGAFHGYAHGAEMPASNTALKYVSGYSLGTALLAGVGVYLMKFINSNKNSEKYIHIIGGIICGAGIMILLG